MSKLLRQFGLILPTLATQISDDRGEELQYSGMPISEVFQKGLGIGGVLSLLWFRRQLPEYVCKFIEMVLMVTADHGPAVSGAHNTIVAARAGKDLVSSLASGLLTIGPRFGGALDEAAAMFTEASDAGMDAEDFVKDMRKKNKLIMGIGHKIKSLTNPDMRVVIIKEYGKETRAVEVVRISLNDQELTCASSFISQKAFSFKHRTRFCSCSRAGHDKKEGKSDFERGRLYCSVFCGLATHLWRL